MSYEPAPGGRHRDHPGHHKGGEIQQKRSDAENGNLSTPIPGFNKNATVGHMREVSGKNGLAAIRKWAEKNR